MMDIFAHETGVDVPVSARLETALRQINFARRYTVSLLEDLETDDWYWTPSVGVGGGDYVSHIAWQCGHITMAMYGLTLYQQRGRDLDVDRNLMSSKFRKLFMRGTTPSPDRDAYPDPDEIRKAMDLVHQQMLKEVPTFVDEELDKTLGPPHAGYDTRYGALLFASHHEMVHAGQIGMLRRLMGKESLR